MQTNPTNVCIQQPSTAPLATTTLAILYKNSLVGIMHRLEPLFATSFGGL